MHVPTPRTRARTHPHTQL
uniref:Uncharacterized protein n=1 Tax=Anguilla anguilla TaxID=7936 RepID=A0A0E9VRZ9_ANGAN